MPASFESSDQTFNSVNTQSKQGRPTKQAEISIHISMQRCFENGISAPSAARLMKVNVKTAYKHYNKITKKFMEKNYDDILEREASERAQIIGTCDNDIIELTELFDTIKGEIQTCSDNSRPVPPILINQSLSIIKSRHAIKERKYSYIIAPTLKEVHRQESGGPNDKP